MDSVSSQDPNMLRTTINQILKKGLLFGALISNSKGFRIEGGRNGKRDKNEFTNISGAIRIAPDSTYLT